MADSSRRSSLVSNFGDKLSNSLSQLSLEQSQQSVNYPSVPSHTPSPNQPSNSYTPRAKTSLSRQTSMNFSEHGEQKGQQSRRTSASAARTVRKQISLSNISTTPRHSLSRQSSIHISRSPSSLDNAVEKYPLSPTPSANMAPTVVILHDSSYKHKYARPGSKSDLASIVERPERIPAAVLGACAAQTRLGQELLSIQKSKRQGSLFDSEVRLVHGGDQGSHSWPEELAQLCKEAPGKLKAGECEVPDKFHQGDLYLCGDSRENLEGCIGAMYDGVDAVFAKPAFKGQKPTKRSFVCIRPPGHHCAEEEPSGFCWINNVHIGIAHAAKVHGLTHAVILDFDLHHGDGSQSIAWTLNDMHQASRKPSPIPQIAYFSLHDINSYPCEIGDMEKVRNASVQLNAHGQCIYNVHLESYSTEEEFWQLYEENYSIIIKKAKKWLIDSMAAHKSIKANQKKEPKAAIFLSAGFDASEHEGASMQRHKVHVPTDFYARFTRDAVAIAEDRATGCDGRVVSVLEGGYSNRAITSGVFAHLVGMATAPLAHENGELSATYESSWWDLTRLSELESMEKKAKRKMDSSLRYLTATVASSAKAINHPRSPRTPNTPTNSTPPTPKTVFVDWATATWNLSHRYIPQKEELVAEQQPQPQPQPPSPTDSTLSVKSTSTSKRHSVIGVSGEPVEIIGGSGRTLRERKAKPEPIIEEGTSRASRRRTVAVVERVRPATAAAITSSANRSSTSAAPVSPTFSTVSGAGAGVAGARRPATAAASRAGQSSSSQQKPAPTRPGTSIGHQTSLRRKPTTSLEKSSTVQRRASTQNLKTSKTVTSAGAKPPAKQKPKPIIIVKEEPNPEMDQLTEAMEQTNIRESPQPDETSEKPAFTEEELEAIRTLEADIERKKSQLEAARLKATEEKQSSLKETQTTAKDSHVAKPAKPAGGVKLAAKRFETTQSHPPQQKPSANLPNVKEPPSKVTSHLPSPPSSDAPEIEFHHSGVETFDRSAQLRSPSAAEKQSIIFAEPVVARGFKPADEASKGKVSPNQMRPLKVSEEQGRQ